jgi:predicted nucleotidyltransferase component of viral defense system
MAAYDDQALHYHEDADRFRTALAFTESVTGFSARLIEKDYYCSLLLYDLSELFESEIVFKGGTCLSKVHAELYRLSEDLDFAISTEVNVPRSDRRMKIAALRDHLAGLSERMPGFHPAEPLRGFNLSRQYIGRYAYRSLVSGQNEFVKVEISLREPLLDPAEHRPARTMLLDPFRNAQVIEPFSIRAMSIHETYAEKFRAALTRKEPAIRDFYDIDYAIRLSTLEPTDMRLHDLVRQKLAVPSNDVIDVSTAKLTELQRQLESHLKPVLRVADYKQFNLERAFTTVKRLAEDL